MTAAADGWTRTDNPVTPTWTRSVGARVAYVSRRGDEVRGELWEGDALKLTMRNSLGRNKVSQMQRRLDIGLVARTIVRGKGAT